MAAWPLHVEPVVAGTLHMTGVFDSHVVAALERIIAPGGHSSCANANNPPLMVDVGANIGFMGLYAAALGCNVLAIEAQPRLHAFLNASRCINAFTRYKPVNVGVSTKDGVMAVPITVGNAAMVGEGISALRKCGNNCVAVPMKRLDELIPSLEGQREVLVMKLDVEGYEWFALKSLNSMLTKRQVRNIIFEFWPTMLKDKSVPLLMMLTRHGFNLNELEFHSSLSSWKNFQANYDGQKVFSDHWEKTYLFPFAEQSPGLGQRNVSLAKIDPQNLEQYVRDVLKEKTGSKRNQVDIWAQLTHATTRK